MPTLGSQQLMRGPCTVLNVEHAVVSRYPTLSQRRPLLARSLISLLRILFHEQAFQRFEARYPHLQGFDFVEQVLRHFDFSYVLRDNERERIPQTGRVVIIANHPIGSLDGLALLKMVREVRADVKVVANQMLTAIKPLQSLLLPVDNMKGETARENLRAIRSYLEGEGAVIIFPAGEVSRLGPGGIRDSRWQSGFLRIANTTRSPVLPVYVNGRNSWFFYGLSWLSRPLSMLWLVREMFKQASRTVPLVVGEVIPFESYQKVGLPLKSKVKLFQRHLYRIGKGKEPVFATQSAIAHPEERRTLRDEVKGCRLLGETQDGKQIYLFHYRPDSSIMREIGRLRELAFRAMGEGTGERRDNDEYDRHYMHLFIWDDADMEIAGAYRLCDTAKVIGEQGREGLYTHTLFRFEASMEPLLARGLELGRSFVQPRYWGKRSLDYLWYGIGALLRDNPHYRYLFGPVSISDSYPRAAKDLLVHFYSHYFGSDEPVVIAREPYRIDGRARSALQEQFAGNDYKEDMARLKGMLAHMGQAVPTLYKQYVEVCEPGGARFLDFNVDPDFANCIDGLVVVDTDRLKPAKRERYLREAPDGRVS